MALIFEVGHGDEKKIPLRLIPFVVGSTWITHLFGGSAGREGVAVQIGATFSHWIGRHLPIKNAGPIFLVAGMAAGFSGLFGNSEIQDCDPQMQTLLPIAENVMTGLPSISRGSVANRAM